LKLAASNLLTDKVDVNVYAPVDLLKVTFHVPAVALKLSPDGDPVGNAVPPQLAVQA